MLNIDEGPVSETLTTVIITPSTVPLWKHLFLYWLVVDEAKPVFKPSNQMGWWMMTIYLINLATYGTPSFVCTFVSRGIIRLDTQHPFTGMRCVWGAASAEVSITYTLLSHTKNMNYNASYCCMRIRAATRCAILALQLTSGGRTRYEKTLAQIAFSTPTCSCELCFSLLKTNISA